MQKLVGRRVGRENRSTRRRRDSFIEPARACVTSQILYVEACSQGVVEGGSKAVVPDRGPDQRLDGCGEPSCVWLAQYYSTAPLKSRTNCRTQDSSDETGKSKPKHRCLGRVKDKRPYHQGIFFTPISCTLVRSVRTSSQSNNYTSVSGHPLYTRRDRDCSSLDSPDHSGRVPTNNSNRGVR